MKQFLNKLILNPIVKKFFKVNLLLLFPIANENDYKLIYQKAKNRKFKEIDIFENKKKFKIDAQWLDNLALYTQVVKKKSLINYQHGRVLYSTLKDYLKKNKYEKINIFETGTARGFSSIVMSKVLNENNQRGKIFTIDILPNNKKIYWNCILDLKGKHTRSELLANWSEELKNITFLTGKSEEIIKNLELNRINFAFLDGAHNFKVLKKEFDYVKIRQKIGDIIVFDDVTDSEFDEIVNFISNIKNHDHYDVNFLKSEKQRGYAIAVKNEN